MELNLLCIKLNFMTNSASGQDGPNPALSLANRGRKMHYNATQGLPAAFRGKKLPENHIMNSLSPSLFGQDGFHIGQVLFLPGYGPSRPINAQIKILANIQPS